MTYVRINKRKYHFIYKTTCSFTCRYYIGMHSTDNLEDGYLGSGTRLSHSIRKYGPENHTREILEFCSSREELIKREEEIVNLNEIAKQECMNIKPGGSGGWANKEHQIKCSQSGLNKINELRKDKDSEFYKKWTNTLSEKKIQNHKDGKIKNISDFYSWKGKHHTEETKRKMSKKDRSGKLNSQYGTMWITNGKKNKKIKKEEKIPEGWTKGRII